MEPALHDVVGTLQITEPIASRHVGGDRPLFVLLPESYEADVGRRYPVLYMHDGQNLFSDDIAFGREWQVDEAMHRLQALGLQAIIVGIPNAGEARMAEYSPFVDASGRGGRGDDYMKFVVEEVIPLVDSRYRSLPTRAGRGMLGSSLGGLISLYGFFRHPETFGFVGAMSPALWFADRALLEMIDQYPFVNGRLYLAIGTEEGPQHVIHVRALHQLLLAKGYRQGGSLFYVEEDDAAHDESAWARRLRTALYFLLPAPEALAT
jgi:isoamylase